MRWFARENRRAAPRARYDGDSTWIRLEEGSLTRPCQVLDLSRTGVRLKLTNPQNLPNTFILILSKYSAGRPVRMKWRVGTELGAEFFTANSSSAARLGADAPRPTSSLASSSAARMSSGAARANSSPASSSVARLSSDAPKATSSSPSALAARLRPDASGTKSSSSSTSRLAAEAPRTRASSAAGLRREAPTAVKPAGGNAQNGEHLVSTLSVSGSAQNAAAVKVNVDARTADSISGDPVKTEVQITGTGNQLDRGDQKITKNRMDLSQLQKKLGPKHVALIDALKDLDPESPYGQELASIIKKLDETCDRQRAG